MSGISEPLSVSICMRVSKRRRTQELRIQASPVRGYVGASRVREKQKKVSTDLKRVLWLFRAKGLELYQLAPPGSRWTTFPSNLLFLILSPQFHSSSHCNYDFSAAAALAWRRMCGEQWQCVTVPWPSYLFKGSSSHFSD